MTIVRQFGSFVAVGIAAAVVHYGLLFGLTEGHGLDPVDASALGYLGGGVTSYLLNYRITFRAVRPHMLALPMFCVVAAVGFVLNWIAMAVLTRPLAVHYLPAQLVATGLVLVWNFAANRWWTFGSATSR